VVPSEGRWYLGAWHFQQWSHAEKDYVAWIEAARKAKQAKAIEASFVMYDIARKLISNNRFLELADEAPLLKEQGETMSESAWQTSMRAVLKDYDVIHVSSLLADDGPGLLIRFRIAEEMSAVAIRNHCQTVTKLFLEQKWYGDFMGGIKCSYVIKGEPEDKEGALGGMFISKADASALKK
jgi:hypothetical protein